MDDSVIVEVTETPDRSPGDGLPRRTVKMEDMKKKPQAEIEDGPWQEADLGKRQKQTLDSGYLTDLTVIAGNTKFRCHKNILSFSSPKLAKMIRENPQTLKLQNMHPRHFRLLLEIIYGGVADKLDNAKEALDVIRAAQELQIYTAVAYCTQILSKLLDATNVMEILDFACLNEDRDLKISCVKVIQEQTKKVLVSRDFPICNIETLKLILSQDVLQTTELELFLACARWAKKHENPRQALEPALCLIRFRVLTADEFIQHVKPTQMLSDKEENEFFMCFLTKDGKVPEGFSNENKKRSMFQCKVLTRKIGAEEEIEINYNGWTSVTTEELNKSPPLQFSATGDLNLIGIQFFSERYGANNTYKVDVTITLKDENESIITSATYRDQVTWGNYYTLKFSSPVPIHDNAVYKLYFRYNVAGETYTVCKYIQKSYKTKTNLEINILNETYSPPISHFIIAPYIQ